LEEESRARINPNMILGLADFGSRERTQLSQNETIISSIKQNKQAPFRLSEIDPTIFKELKEQRGLYEEKDKK